jgi:hypothetical protein
MGRSSAQPPAYAMRAPPAPLGLQGVHPGLAGPAGPPGPGGPPHPHSGFPGGFGHPHPHPHLHPHPSPHLHPHALAHAHHTHHLPQARLGAGGLGPGPWPPRRVSHFALLVDVFDTFADFMWRDLDVSLDGRSDAPVGRPGRPGWSSGGGELRTPMQVFPPHALLGENAARGVTVSTFSALRAELKRARAAVVEFLERMPRDQGGLSELPLLADALWETLFDPVDFFRQPKDAVFLVFDLTFVPDDGLEVVGEVDGRRGQLEGGEGGEGGVCVDTDGDSVASDDVDGCASLAQDDDGGGLNPHSVRFGSVSEAGPASVLSALPDDTSAPGGGLRMPRSPRSVSSACSEDTSASRAGLGRQLCRDFAMDRASVDDEPQDDVDDDDHTHDGSCGALFLDRDGGDRDGDADAEDPHRDRSGGSLGGGSLPKRVSGKTSVVTDVDGASLVSAGGWTVLSYEPVLRPPPGVYFSLSRRRQWFRDVFAAWVGLVEKNVLTFCRDVEQQLLPLKSRLPCVEGARNPPVRSPKWWWWCRVCSCGV